MKEYCRYDYWYFAIIITVHVHVFHTDFVTVAYQLITTVLLAV